MEITRLLRAWSDGDQEAFGRLATAVYAELCRIAHGYMRHERPDQTMQATALVHEAYLRLVEHAQQDSAAAGARSWANRRHFFARADNDRRDFGFRHSLCCAYERWK